MSGILEQLLAEQQKTNSLLETLIANGGAAPAGGDAADAGKGKSTTAKRGAGKTNTTEKAKPTHTKDEVVAAVVAVKDAFGAPAAKAITAQFGLAKIAEAKEDQFDAIFDACQEKLAEKQEEEEEV
ncbi:TPA: hypothetical protein ACGCAJ_004719 [Serratia marcescens]